MNIRDVYSAKAIALVNTEVASNKIAYLGSGLFPAKKKMGLDLKWIKTSKGLPVSLAPSNFDAVSTLRSREGFKLTETEMAFFRESMLIKEADEQEIAKGSTNPGGGTAGGNKDNEKTEAEKAAESIGKTLAGTNQAAKSVVDSYLS